MSSSRAMANLHLSQLVTLLLLATALQVEKVTSTKMHRPISSSYEPNDIHKGSFRNLLSYLPLDKIGGGLVLREIGDEIPFEKTSSSLTPEEKSAENYEEIVDSENIKLWKLNKSRIPLAKNLDLMGSTSPMKRKLHTVSIPNDKRNFDEIDRSGFRSMGKRNFDEIDGSGFRGMGKRNFDEIDGSGFRGMGKRNFDEIDGSGFRGMGKRNFDEIDGSGFRGMGKRNFDEIDGSGFRGMGKRNFDEIDGAGFNNMGKRNFDEIDRSVFGKMGKKSFDEIYRAGFHILGKNKFDGRDRTGLSNHPLFNEIDRAILHTLEKPEFIVPSDNTLNLNNIEKNIEGVSNMDTSKQKIKDMINFDEFNKLGRVDEKKFFNENDKFDFSKIDNGNNEIDGLDLNSKIKRKMEEFGLSGFNHVDKRQAKELLKSHGPSKEQIKFDKSREFERDSFKFATNKGIEPLTKNSKSNGPRSFSSTTPNYE